MGIYLVTGACGGMGSAICALLSSKGHRVFGLDRRAPSDTPLWTYLPADVTDGETLEAALSRVREDAGTLDGILCTAGIYDLGSLAEMAEADFVHDFDVNLFGAFRTVRTFLPLLGKNGRIVLLSSELAPLYPLPFTGIYAVTKTAVEQYAAALAMEVQLLGHRVVVVRPGAVQTALLNVSTEKLSRFCEETRLYAVNASRFRRIVDRVEARSVSPEKIAAVIEKALTAARPKLVYKVNRNPLLLLLNALPRRLQLWIIKRILT